MSSYSNSTSSAITYGHTAAATNIAPNSTINTPVNMAIKTKSKTNKATEIPGAINSKNIPEYSTLKSLKSHLMVCLDADIPLMIFGSYGIGKTALIKSLPQDQYPSYVVDLATIDVPDINGIMVPDLVNKTSYFTEPSIITQMNKLSEENPDKDVILFFDDLTNADPALHAGLFRLIQFKSIGDYSLPERTKIVCAGNTSENSTVANDLPKPLLTRMSVCEYKGPSVDEWCSYANSKDVEPEIIAAIRNAPECLTGHLIQDENEDFSDALQMPTPRGWESCSAALTQMKANNVKSKIAIRNTIASFVGLKMASQVTNMIDLYPTVVKFEDIIESGGTTTMPEVDNNSSYYLQAEIINSGLLSFVEGNKNTLNCELAQASGDCHSELSDLVKHSVKFMSNNKMPKDFIYIIFNSTLSSKNISKSKVLSKNAADFTKLFKNDKTLTAIIRELSVVNDGA